jgi:hypothetical protein
MIRVHNISDRPNSSALPRAIMVGATLLRPGKFAEVFEAQITPALRKLHGSHLWIGTTPAAKFMTTSKSALRALQADVSPMSTEEARAYLATLERDELLHLCEQVAPPLTFERAPGKAMLTILLSRAIFEPARVLNPESFFWLRRWTKHGAEFEERA